MVEHCGVLLFQIYLLFCHVFCKKKNNAFLTSSDCLQLCSTFICLGPTESGLVG